MEHHRSFPKTQATLIDALDQSLRDSVIRAAPQSQAAVVPQLQDRLLRHGGDFLDDGDVLVLMLGCSPKVAKRLLDRFGDLGGVLAAPERRLREVANIDRTAMVTLKLAQVAAHRLAQARILNRQVLDSWDNLLTYCQTVMAHQDVEQFRVLFLDNKNVLIADEAQARGTVDHVPVYPREVIKRALELNASALILVHNHPSGDPTPSESDRAVTDHVNQAAQVMGIVLHDHLVIGRGCHISFRAQGYLT